MTLRELVIKPLTRSSGWGRVRREHINANPACTVCGRTRSLEVHHIADFSNHPDKELDPDNLVTLCSGGTKCHFTFGHLGNWRRINTGVLEDCRYFVERFKK